MTRSEWLSCQDPQRMLEFLRGKVSDRKLRLFAVACCRRVIQLAHDPRCQWAIQIADQVADGLVTEVDACAANNLAYELIDNGSEADHAIGSLVWQVSNPLIEVITWVSTDVVRAIASEAVASVKDPQRVHRDQDKALNRKLQRRKAANDQAVRDERLGQVAILRDVIGNPFATITLNTAWLTATITSLAQSIYDNRSFEQLPILADALEEAGCTDAELLGHLRSKGSHVRGCWALDAILGKE